MSDYQNDYIAYRLAKAEESLNDAKLLAANQSWNACVNRLYYSCYYAVSALLQKNRIQTQTHSGQKGQFGLHFVKTGQISIEHGKLYADLFDARQKGDYGDMYDHDRGSVEPLFEPVENFLAVIKELIAAN